MHSALFHGWLDHRRHTPVPHAFRYGVFMAWLDLAELDQVFRGRWLWSVSRPSLVRFDRSDHFGEPDLPLDESVRRLVAQHTGTRPEGPIRLLTNLRWFGYVFNPVSFFYCLDAQGREVETIVAEVNNTPWGERHCYVLHRPTRNGRWLEARSTKAMHVSPFHPMGLDYLWRFDVAGEALDVAMALLPTDAPQGTQPVFHAHLALQRIPITGRSLAMTLLRFPFMSAQVVVGIHWQALKLWLKRVPVHHHPAASTKHTP